VLLGFAPFRSAPLGVLRPQPHWGRAWSPISLLFFYIWVDIIRIFIGTIMLTGFAARRLKSQTGLVLNFGKEAVSCRLQRQPTVSRSTVSTDYRAEGEAAKDAQHLCVLYQK
jgi:hypothetical protein